MDVIIHKNDNKPVNLYSLKNEKKDKYAGTTICISVFVLAAV